MPPHLPLWLQRVARCFLPALMLFSAPLAAEAPLLVMTEEIAPHSALRNGEIVGSSTALVEALLKDAGITYRLELRSWKAVIQTAETSSPVLIYPIARTAAREPLFQWIGQLSTLEHRLYRLKQRTDLQPARLEDLHGHAIAVIARDARQAHLLNAGFKQGDELVEVTDNEQALHLLRVGRVDYAPLPSGRMFDELCRKAQQDCTQFEPTIPLGLEFPLYLAANRATPPDTLTRLRSSWRRLVDKGGHWRPVKP